MTAAKVHSTIQHQIAPLPVAPSPLRLLVSDAPARRCPCTSRSDVLLLFVVRLNLCCM